MTLEDNAKRLVRPRWRPSVPRRYGLLLALVLMLQAALSWSNPDSYWNDEFFSVYWSKLPLSWLWGEGFRVETTPPVYYTLLHFFLQYRLDRIVDGRAISTVFSVLNTGVIYLVARRLFSSRTAVVAALILALMPANLHYAAEARSYALAQLLISVILLCFASLRLDGALRARPTVALVLAGCLLIYVHTTMLLYLGILFALEGWRSRTRPREMLALGGAGLAVLIVAAPAVVNAVAQANAPGLAWIHPPQLLTVAALAAFLVTGPVALAHNVSLAIAISLPFVVAIPLIGYARSPAPKTRTLVFWFPLASVVAVILVSLIRSIFIFRIFAWLDSLLAIQAAVCLTTMAPGLRRSLVAAVVVAPLTLGLFAHLTASAGENWRPLVHVYQTSAQPADIAVVGPSASPFAWDFYGVPLPAKQLLRWQGYDGVRPTAEALLDRLYGRTTPISTDELAREISTGHGVWLVLSSADWVEGGRNVPRSLEALGKFQETRYGGLLLLRWEPPR